MFACVHFTLHILGASIFDVTTSLQLVLTHDEAIVRENGLCDLFVVLGCYYLLWQL
jgi:hypothetical protein